MFGRNINDTLAFINKKIQRLWQHVEILAEDMDQCPMNADAAEVAANHKAETGMTNMKVTMKIMMMKMMKTWEAVLPWVPVVTKMTGMKTMIMAVATEEEEWAAVQEEMMMKMMVMIQTAIGEVDKEEIKAEDMDMVMKMMIKDLIQEEDLVATWIVEAVVAEWAQVVVPQDTEAEAIVDHHVEVVEVVAMEVAVVVIMEIEIAVAVDAVNQEGETAAAGQTAIGEEEVANKVVVIVVAHKDT